MKKLLVLSALALASCSDSDHPTEILVPDQTCSMKDVANGVEYTCGPNTFVIYDGKDSEVCKIETNEDGLLSYNCEGEEPIILNPPRGSSEGQEVVPSVTGPKGDKGDKGDKGEDGKDGKDGKDGSIVRVWTDKDGCLWISIDGGTQIKLRGPL